MRRSLAIIGIVTIAVAVMGCGPQRDVALRTPAAAGTPTESPAAVAKAVQQKPPSRAVMPFGSPLAAMRYLAAGYNKGNLSAVRHVTSPTARADLIAMRATAVNLTLESCTREASGNYVCAFRHDFPTHLHRQGHGAATVLVAPADKPGWYMSALIDCD